MKRKRVNIFKKMRILAEEKRGTKPQKEVDEKIIYIDTNGNKTTVTRRKKDTNDE